MNKPIPDYELLSAYLDDELRPEERARVEQRLATDPEYAATLDAFRDQQQRLRAMPKGSIDVRQRVMDAVEGKSAVAAAESRSGQKLNLWAMASLAALILLGVFLFLPDFGKDQVVVQNESSSTPVVVERKVDKKVEDEGFQEENETAAVANEMAMAAQDVIPGSRWSGLERRMASEVEGGESDDAWDSDAESELAAVDAAAAKSALADVDDAQPTIRNDLAMKFHTRQNEMLDMEALAGSDVEPAPEKLQQQSNANGIARSRSAVTAPFSKAAPSSVVRDEADERTLRSKAGGSDENELADTRSDSESVSGEAVVGDGVKVLKQLEGRGNRIWRVGPSYGDSKVPLTLVRFREELETAGCDYREERVWSISDKAERGIEFIVAATPEQLAKFRSSVKRFAMMQRFDRMLRSMAVPETQSSWDGSRLPRVNGLDPPGDRRVYLFRVFAEKEPPSPAKE